MRPSLARLLLSLASVLPGFASAGYTTPPIAPLTTSVMPEGVPSQPFGIPLDRPFNQLTFATTHNSFAYYTPILRNQDKNIGTQLRDGVGGLMLDLHEYKGRVFVCHESCTNPINTKIYSLANWFNEDILPHMQQHPEAILTVFFEDQVTKAQLEAELKLSPGLANMTFDPASWPDSAEWPTARQMIAKGQRILLFTDSTSNHGTFNVGNGKATVMLDRDAMVENNWNLGDTIFSHNWSCDNHPFKPALNNKQVKFSGKRWPSLFLMNQFHSQGETLHARSDNNLSNLWKRVENKCRAKTDRTPNFIAVDFYHQGDALEYAATLSHGGMVLWEGNNATQDAVCAIPYTGRPYAVNFQASNQRVSGCENDEARSATLLNLKAGSVISIYDSPSRSREDDWTTLEVTKDFEKITINSFETARWPDGILLKWVNHNNGLDGKVSSVTLGYPEPPMIVFYEGNHTSQNIVCTLVMPGSGRQFVNFQHDPYGCDNDEARSARFYNMKKGQHVTIYDSPNGAHKDDNIQIEILKDIKYFSLPTFEQSVSDPSYRATFYRKNGLDGKVSGVLMEASNR